MATKKLIEVALPLEKINAESAREKSIRHGHPSTLHLWWARRPLAAARAVIWSSLVDDPSSHPDKFPTEEEQNRERQRLFRILEDLVVWENSNDERVLEAAKAEILKSAGGNPPELLDPFAGGGAIPFEAKRLGLKSHAHDLNPVPVVLNKAMMEIPVRFAGKPSVNPEEAGFTFSGDKCSSSISKDVAYYGSIVKEMIHKEMENHYPAIRLPKEYGGIDAPVIAWLWARTIKCPNPACKCQMPLLKSRVIAKNIAYLEIEKDKEGTPLFYVRYGMPNTADGTVNRKGARCEFCGEPVSFNYIRAEGKAGRISSQLMAVVAKGKRGRVYVSPTIEQKQAAQVAIDEELQLGHIANYPGYLNPPAYGLDTFEALFTKRQAAFLMKLGAIIKKVAKKVEDDAIRKGFENDHLALNEGGSGARAYSEAIRLYLSFVADKVADYNSAVCSWNAVGQKMRNRRIGKHPLRHSSCKKAFANMPASEAFF